jgi:ornithine cyclodeaminase/alanine dehydrogenase-like protein (mu-crystallin family)
MSAGTVRYLSRAEVEAAGVPMRDVIAALEQAFERKGQGSVEMPPKPAVHPRPDAFIHAMPAFVEGMDITGMKWISGFPENRARGLPYISGLLVLNEAGTGLPIAVMDATWITAVRTGAATAVAARYLARPESSTVGIVACGVQGRSNVEALACVFPLRAVRAYDVDPEAAEGFAIEVRERHGLTVDVVLTARDAVSEADLVVTSGPILKHPAPVIEAGWLAPGAFACPLDFDSMWQGAAFAQIDKLATDDRPQLEHYRTVGYFRETPEPYADLGDLAVGRAPGRERDDERTMSLNLGLALEDVATATLVYRRAVERGIGVELPL